MSSHPQVSSCIYINSLSHKILSSASGSVKVHDMVICLLFAGAIMSAIYEDKKDEDGFLYVTYSGENTFGSQIPL